MMKNNLMRLIGASVLVGTLTGCGKASSWLKDVNVRTGEQNSATIFAISASLETGTIPLPSVDLPIPNPQNKDEVWGRLAIRPIVGTSRSEIEIKGYLDNIPKTSSCAGGKDKLPNGLNIPLSVDPNSLVCLSVFNSKAQIYVASNLTTKTLMVGTAIPIRQFDDIIKDLPNANAFLKFNFANVTGNFGVFTGSGGGQNGLALFVDASKAIGGKLRPRMFFETINRKQAAVLGDKLQDLERSGERLSLY